MYPLEDSFLKSSPNAHRRIECRCKTDKAFSQSKSEKGGDITTGNTQNLTQILLPISFTEQNPQPLEEKAANSVNLRVSGETRAWENCALGEELKMSWAQNTVTLPPCGRSRIIKKAPI